MMNAYIAAFFLMLGIFIPSAAFCQNPTEYGLFVWSLDEKQVLSSKTQMDNLVDFARKNHIKTIFIQVYRANKAWFPTKHADTTDYDASHRGSSYDSLAYFIEQAHLYNIQVHAWMNLLSLGGNDQAPMLKKYGPGILTRNNEPKKLLEDYKIDRQFFLEPSDPNVKKELLGLIEDLLKRHKNLDGIQFDYIRYPDVHPFYGYSPYNIQQFKKLTGIKEIKEEDSRWKQFKRDRVTDLLKALVQKVRSIRPKIHVSTTGCLSLERASYEALQDWPLWLKEGVVEFVTVMNYPSNKEEFQKNILEIKGRLKEDFNKVNVGVGAYKFEKDHADVFEGQWESCRQSDPRSCVIFHYGSLLKNPALADSLK